MRKKKKVNANETYMQTVMRRFRAHHLAKISLVILVVVGLAALFAPVVAPYDPDAISSKPRLFLGLTFSSMTASTRFTLAFSQSTRVL